MDPVTIAVVAAISAGVAEKLIEGPAADLYSRLKASLVRKFGRRSGLVESIDQLEVNPGSEPCIARVVAEATAMSLDSDPELTAQAHALMLLLNIRATGSQTAIGNNIAQADRHGTASVNINRDEGSGSTR